MAYRRIHMKVKHPEMLVIVVYVTFRFRFLTQSRIHMKVNHSKMLLIVVCVTSNSDP